jgi:hypothetical protein
MKNIVNICLLLGFIFFSPYFIPLQAKENQGERVYIHTDKDCYVAGENIFVKFYAFDMHFQPSSLSKVGYVEICDSERPQMQLKLALDKGSGAGIIKIPFQIPSGVYQLSGYTRFMRNESENVFFKRQIAIINAGLEPDSTKVTLSANVPEKEKETSNIRLATDKKNYSGRSLVKLTLENLPDHITDLVVSVSRNDSLVNFPLINRQEWLKKTNETSTTYTLNWLPEYEGHIITGKILPAPGNEPLLSNIAFVGKDISYINGKTDASGTATFFTNGIYGKQGLAASVTSVYYETTPYRLDILSPFCESLPYKLPALQVSANEKAIMERYLGAQLEKLSVSDTLNNKIYLDNYYNLPVSLTYNLDEYTRFGTVGETIFEFVRRLRVVNKDGVRKITAYVENEYRYNTGSTLVLLDGIPVYDHEIILQYDPQDVERINIYSGKYVFGGEIFECIASFITHRVNLSTFRLDKESQLLEYYCPALPEKFKMPNYADPEVKNSRKPDFRHTLYWNPFVEIEKDQSVQLSFYTSDLTGSFEVIVEGITGEGKLICGHADFTVK